MDIKPWLKQYVEQDKAIFVGEGWRPLVTKLAKDIIAINDGVQVIQVKEKFGGLRFYIYGGNDKIYDLLEKAECNSFKICEVCGSKENVKTKGIWILTLCNKCRKTKNKEMD